MYIEIDQEQLAVIRELVESRIRELHPTIRRSRVSTVHDSLKEDLRKLEDLQQRLSSAKADPVA
jgi:hypothetical protein